jgi:hypothetical protein
LRRALPGKADCVPGWIFVSALLAAATVLAAASDRPLGLLVALVVVTLISAVAGALLRPDRQATDRRIDRPADGTPPSVR